VNTEDTETIREALQFAMKRCVCGGSGISITWDMNGGSPIEKCKVCKPYRIALAKLMRAARYRMTG